jgi:predicted transcriptional regulator
VRDVDLWKAATVQAGERVGDVRARLADADIEYPLLVDDQGRPQGWLSERGLTGERVRPELRSPAEPLIDIDDVLRDALGHLLSEETRYAPVVDGTGRCVGVLSLDVIAHALQVPAEDVPSAGDLLAS